MIDARNLFKDSELDPLDAVIVANDSFESVRLNCVQILPLGHAQSGAGTFLQRQFDLGFLPTAKQLIDFGASVCAAPENLPALQKASSLNWSCRPTLN